MNNSSDIFSKHFLIIVILLLIRVAFLTLLERKFISIIQIRKGPNKVGYKRLLQPFSDALKLSNNNYSILGSIRSIAQIILFEITGLLSSKTQAY
ncbi:PREDICTED: NADH-ubiquinone oxidoreductase chain 1-like [Eufriesea mexicana]|uniref:NADH-ubiquinone oxidoreductase chain 1-like n=1 Tax=Eufriesea mexicana TaxID=516756 RepID=UPI00083C636D|nr:PREDICTED: NADH-ubiquinone oxidoreductase chain 1-like [Eufriesea mexicana]